MKKSVLQLLSVLAFLAPVIGGCVAAAQPPATNVNSVYTQAAQTVAMRLTLEAGVAAVATLTQEVLVTPTFTPTTPPLTPTTAVIPTDTPKPPTITPTPVPCDAAEFVSDVTVKDGTVFSPGAEFVKTWRLRNIGSCTWNRDYELLFYKGDQMSEARAFDLPKIVGPGDRVDISVDLVAPDEAGIYRAEYILSNDEGDTFGIGEGANQPFWVKIKVEEPTRFVYEFADNYCDAIWETNAGPAECPGGAPDTDASLGYVTRLDKPVLEKGGKDNEPALLTFPGSGPGGFISGRFPAINIKSGDHFKVVIGCLDGAAGCNVTFQLNYSAEGIPLKSLGSWTEVYDNEITRVDIPLKGLAGKSVQFILVVFNNGNNADDLAFWLRPGILRIPKGAE
jgi:hypothetical protein